MTSISTQTWMGPPKKSGRKYRRIRRRVLHRDKRLSPIVGYLGFRTNQRHGKFRALVINPGNGSFTAFVQYEIQEGVPFPQKVRIRLPKKIGASMFLSLIKRGLFP